MLLLYLFIAVFYGGWAVLWLTQAPLYPAFLQFMGVKPVVASEPSYAHPPMPFFDLEGVISWSECARRGVDVYSVNPCDPAPYHRPANYSPLLVDLPLERIGTRNALIAGLIADLAFLLLLPLVFRPRTRKELAVAVAASWSSATFYAVERANIDVVVFTMICLAALASQRSIRGRFWLYAVGIAGALIKFYPLVLGGLALRERPRVLVVTGLAFTTIVVIFLWFYGPQLQVVTHKIPAFHYFSDMFGAGALPLTLQRVFDLPPWLVRPLKLALLAGLAVFAVSLSGRLEIALPHSIWLKREMVLLLCGSLITVGCFVVQTNNSYREIFLIFTIPGLFQLARRAKQSTVLIRWALAGLLLLMWSEMIRGAAGRWKPAVWSLFFLREVVWWFVAAVLAGIMLCFFRQAPALRAWTQTLARTRFQLGAASSRADN